MKTKSNTGLPKIIVVSTGKYLGDSLQWVVRKWGGQISFCDTRAELQAKIRGDRYVVVVLCQSEAIEFDYWLWTVVRGKYCNPVIMLGYEGYATFCKKHLECRLYQCNHEYRPIPFLLFADTPASMPEAPELTGLLKCAAKMSPMSEAEREFVVANFSRPAARLLVEAHNIRRLTDSQKRNMLLRLRDILCDQGNAEALGEVETALRLLELSGKLAECYVIRKLIEGAAKYEAKQKPL